MPCTALDGQTYMLGIACTALQQCHAQHYVHSVTSSTALRAQHYVHSTTCTALLGQHCMHSTALVLVHDLTCLSGCLSVHSLGHLVVRRPVCQ